MPRSVPILCLLSSLASLTSVSAQVYATDFETFVASTTGTPCAGQDLFYVPPVAGSIDAAIWTYAGNTLGIPANANGGLNFFAARAITGSPSRAQRPITLPSNLIHVEFDVLCSYVGAITPVNNIGSFSFQPSATSVYVNVLAAWPTGVVFPPTTWNANVVAGTATPPTTIVTVLADPAFQGLAVGVWHRWGFTIDLATGLHVNFSIRNGVSGITTVHTPATPLLLPIGASPLTPITDFRLFAGGPDNVFAVDNLTITYGASYTTFGTGCPGAIGIPTLAAATGSLPILGTTLGVEVGNLPFGVGLMITGLSNTLWAGAIPLPFPLGGIGYPGCDLLVDPMIIDTVIGPGTTATWSLPIPLNQALAGFTFYNQGASVQAGPVLLAFSNGGRAVVGL